MKLLLLSLVLAFLVVGCAHKDEVALDSDMGAGSTSERDSVQKDEVGKDDYTITPNATNSDGSDAPAGLSNSEPNPMTPSIGTVAKKKKSKLSFSKECKVRAKASASAKVLKKMKKGQTVTVSSVGKAWYKVSSGGFVPKSCFK